MRLKKLQLFGFKTFPEPVELHFPEGVTAFRLAPRALQPVKRAA